MENFNFTIEGQKTALVIDTKDNVATVLCDCMEHDKCLVIDDCGNRFGVIVLQDISFGHKVALTEIAKGQGVYKYGEEIGKAKKTIKKGDWVHAHNMYCDRGLK